VLARLLGNPGYRNAYTEKVDRWVTAHALAPIGSVRDTLVGSCLALGAAFGGCRVSGRGLLRLNALALAVPWQGAKEIGPVSGGFADEYSN
jgi:hypothetical protein